MKSQSVYGEQSVLTLGSLYKGGDAIFGIKREINFITLLLIKKLILQTLKFHL